MTSKADLALLKANGHAAVPATDCRRRPRVLGEAAALNEQANIIDRFSFAVSIVQHLIKLIGRENIMQLTAGFHDRKARGDAPPLADAVRAATARKDEASLTCEYRTAADAFAIAIAILHLTPWTASSVLMPPELAVSSGLARIEAAL
ncbi:hypothetical protein Q5752_005469 [Cryptotrichosporon argae]